MMLQHSLAVIYLFGLPLLLFAASTDPPNSELAASGDVVSAPVGKLRGLKRESPTVGTVYAFTGIPYAKPPVGELRYRKPHPVTPWGDDIKDATKTPPSCMQVSVVMPRNQPWVPYDQETSEDCLYLNVWTPTLNGSAGLPVMAWLHGGGFQVGSAAMPVDDGGNLASLGNVVVVTIGYRLRSFGFLYDGTDAAPGNQGLHDQVLALTWIRDNIAAFGGNPNQVTLFGWSAGGFSTGFHLLSPGSQSLFKRAIIQSAGVTRKGRAQDKSTILERSRRFASIFGCYNDSAGVGDSSSSFVPCMQNLNATLVTVVDQGFVDTGRGKLEPIFGDDFLPEEPAVAAFPGDKDVLIGQVANEGMSYVYIDFREAFSHVLPPKMPNKAEILYYLGRLYRQLSLPQLTKLQEEYMSVIGDYEYGALRQAMADTKGDSHVKCSSLNTACKLANATAATDAGRGVHFYQMDYVSNCSKRHPWFGMTHGDDIALVFGRPFDEEGGCKADIPFSRIVITIWTDFAKGRTPIGPKGVAWPKFTSDSREFLKLQANGTSVSHFDMSDRCKVLKELQLL